MELSAFLPTSTTLASMPSEGTLMRAGTSTLTELVAAAGAKGVGVAFAGLGAAGAGATGRIAAAGAKAANRASLPNAACASLDVTSAKPTSTTAMPAAVATRRRTPAHTDSPGRVHMRRLAGNNSKGFFGMRV